MIAINAIDAHYKAVLCPIHLEIKLLQRTPPRIDKATAGIGVLINCHQQGTLAVLSNLE
jgi:hypothetical protein